jgi:hypothetical protein
MSHPREATREAVAFQLTALLERYEADIERLARTWLDMQLYSAVSREVDLMRMHCGTLPQVSVQWVGLLIAHAELLQCLWGHQRGHVSACELGTCRDNHAASLRALQAKCRMLFSRSGR